MNKILDNIKVISKMKENNLQIRLIKEYDSEKLLYVCDRINSNEVDKNLYLNKNYIQNEIILNDMFIDWLQKFNGNVASLENLDKLLEITQNVNERITDYGLEQIKDAFEKSFIDMKTCYNYIKFFSILAYKSKIERDNIVNNLNYFYQQEYSDISELSEAERKLFIYPYLSNKFLIPLEDIKKVCNYLVEDENIRSIIKLFYRKKLFHKLNIENYEAIHKNSKSIYIRLCNLLDNNKSERFYYVMVKMWINNGCNEYDLRVLEDKIDELKEEDIDNVFYSRSTYINFLYGNKISNINFSEIGPNAERMLIYAIVNNKKSFIKLVSENASDFLKIADNSLLFNQDVYTRLLNINSLTKKNLIELEQMNHIRYINLCLLNGKDYTFEEIKTLYNLSEQYILLYNLLLDLKCDERLLRIKQIIKKKLLDTIVKDSELEKISVKLKEKTLYKWIENDFKNIKNLKAENAMNMLIHYDKLEKFMPEITDEIEVLYLIRNIDKVESYKSLEDVKNNIEDIDCNWRQLASFMNLSEEFIKDNSETIKEFLLKNGAEIATIYYKQCRTSSQKESYKLIVKSELMGKFKKLKYHNNDLQKEIDYNLTGNQVEEWITNRIIEKNDLNIGEYDDFYSTMILGENPHRTCMSYKDGMYNYCLLACFDSNKKILYAKKDGKVVARAMIRLTKGKYNCNDEDRTLEFVDLENENNDNTSNKEKEILTLFLERPYISGLTMSEEKYVKKLFVELLEKKSIKINALLVLSNYYSDLDLEQYVSSTYSMLISKSKAGAQYLDSLHGNAKVSDEGKYVSNRFLIWNK